MVQIIPNRHKSFSEQILEGVNAAAPEFHRMQENEAASKLGLDISAYRDPQLRKELLMEAHRHKTQLQRAKDMASALKGNQSHSPSSMKASPENLREKTEEEFEPRFTSKLPGLDKGKYRSEKNQFFPENIGGQEPPGNFPQSETEGIKRTLLTPEEKVQKTQDITNKFISAGVPITPSEVLGLINEQEAQKESYNKQVESDTAQRVQSQQIYGQRAREKLQKLMPNATDELLAYFAKKGEEIAPRTKSEADIDRYLATEAKKFKNTLANVKESVPAPRLFEKIKSTVLGYDRNFDKVKSDIRLKLNPLLKDGLYDTARNTLSELGYHPEERESIITDLSENPKKIISGMPDIKKREMGVSTYAKPFPESSYSQKDKQKVRQALSDVFSSDPSSNLILLRKAFEEKGVDWQEFKDQLNDLVNSGEVQLNDDQFESLNTIDQPPLNMLEKILHGLKLIGR
jgi:hypothetical protein